MIKDKENARYIHLGHGTVNISVCQDRTSYVIHESEKGSVDGIFKKAEYQGHYPEELPIKSICLVFDGKDAIKSIDMIIEDLQTIKEKLEENHEH